MRWTVVVMGLVACGGGTAAPEPAPVPAPAPVEPAAPVPEEPVASDLWKGLEAAGACAADDDVNPMVVPTELGGEPVLLITCALFAYQGTFEVWRATGPGFEAVVDDAGAPVRGLGLPVADGDRLAWLEKDRGIGDCGGWHVYRMEGGRLLQVEHRMRTCDDGDAGDPADPGTWTPVLLTGTLTATTSTPAGCSISLDDGAPLAVARAACADETLQGRRVRATFGQGMVKALPCPPDATCPAEVSRYVVTGVTPI